MNPDGTTNSTGVLDKLFDTVEKGFGLWTQYETAKTNLAAQQVRNTAVTDVNKQPSASAISIKPETIVLGIAGLGALGVLIWALRSR